jgi:hypothetical protein
MADSAQRQQIEQELDHARELGRWPSDDELVARAQEQDQLRVKEQTELHHRGKLLALTVVSLLIPPLWPLAFGLSLYLLFPRSTRRIAMAAGLGLSLLLILLIGLSAGLVIWLCLLLF